MCGTQKVGDWEAPVISNISVSPTAPIPGETFAILWTVSDESGVLTIAEAESCGDTWTQVTRMNAWLNLAGATVDLGEYFPWQCVERIVGDRYYGGYQCLGTLPEGLPEGTTIDANIRAWDPQGIQANAWFDTPAQIWPGASPTTTTQAPATTTTTTQVPPTTTTSPPCTDTGENVTTITVPSASNVLVSDGTFLWLASWHGGPLMKLRPSDGSVVSTYPDVIPAGLGDLVFDGTHIWLANGSADTISRFRPVDGVVDATYPVGDGPASLVAVGSYIWVANVNDGTVSRLRRSDGAVSFVKYVGQHPFELVFDGTHIWVVLTMQAGAGDYTVLKLDSSDGTTIGTYALEEEPSGIVFDGEYIWVTTRDEPYGWLSKLRVSDGAIVDTFALPYQPHPYVTQRDMAFDGTYIWVLSNNWLSKLRVSDGTEVAHYPVGPDPKGVLFDGTYIWTANSMESFNFELGWYKTVSRILASASCAEISAIPGPPIGVSVSSGVDVDQTGFLDLTWNAAEGGQDYLVELWRSVDGGVNYAEISEVVVSGLSHRFLLAASPGSLTDTRYRVVVYGRGSTGVVGPAATVSGLSPP